MNVAVASTGIVVIVQVTAPAPLTPGVAQLMAGPLDCSEPKVAPTVPTGAKVMVTASAGSGPRLRAVTT